MQRQKLSPLSDVGWMSQTPPCRHNVLFVSYRIVGPNKQTLLWGQTNPTLKSEIDFDTICNGPLPTVQILSALNPNGLDFKTRLQGYEEFILIQRQELSPYLIWDVTMIFKCMKKQREDRKNKFKVINYFYMFELFLYKN